jgi:Co/Zn/Cd efflux system component
MGPNWSPFINPSSEPRIMITRLSLFLSFGAIPHFGAWAHEGHGLSGSHWHASDALGFVAALVVGVAAWYLGNRK